MFLETFPEVSRCTPEFLETFPEFSESVPEFLESVPKFLEKIPEVSRCTPKVLEKILKNLEKILAGILRPPDERDYLLLFL
jgi:hypothetical protein